VKKVLFGMKEGVFGMQEHVLDMSMLVVRRILVFADRTDGVFVLQEVVAGEKRFFWRGIELVEERSADIFLPFFPWQVLIPMNRTCANRFGTRFYTVKRESSRGIVLAKGIGRTRNARNAKPPKPP
jgi:hypothetical protein